MKFKVGDRVIYFRREGGRYLSRTATRLKATVVWCREERARIQIDNEPTMSHVVSIAVELTDLEAIKATCKELGLTFKQGQQTYRWYGYSAGDYPLPPGFTAADLGKCEHAIEVPGAGYDIGLARNKNGKGWTMLFDFYGPGQPILKAVGGEKAHKFTQLYGANKATLTARKLGCTVKRTAGKNGSINLVCAGGRI